MNKQKVMIIGAGSGQVPLIECCKKHHLETLVVSPKGLYPGIEKADIHIEEDIYNVENLIRIGKKEKISYVISDQSDYAVPIVAKISEALQLRGNSLNTAETYTFKSNFRKFCQEEGIPSPKFITISGFEDLKNLSNFSYPLIVKPADSQGSRGITLVKEEIKLKDSVELALSFSKNNLVVIEEYFVGREIVCEGFVLDGEYYNVAFGDREYFSMPNKFIPSKTIFPSSISQNIKNKIIQNEQKISSLLKPKFGIIHSEYIIDENENFIIVESALRGGGVYIASHLIPFTTGIDLTEVLFQAMVGNIQMTKKLLKNKSSSLVAEYLCFYLNAGIVTSLNKLNKEKYSDIKFIDIENIKIGDKINKFEHKGQRKGPILIASKNTEELQKTESLIKEDLNIEIDNRPGIHWL